jgi:hypothetical protein
MEAMRDRWTDDRMDDLVQRVDAGFAQVHEDIAGLRVDNRELRRDMGGLASRQELHTEVQSLRSEMCERFDQVDQRFSKVDAGFDKVDRRFEALNGRFDALQRTLFGAILAGFIGLLITQLG